MNPDKGQNLLRRARFAMSGFGHAFRRERSFRTHCIAAAAVLAVVLVLRPGWLWAGTITIMVGLVLALELVNTAIEHLLDGLHPDNAPFVAVAKDCAAAAVLVASTAAVAVFIFMLADLAGCRYFPG